MNNDAIDELIDVLKQLGPVMHELNLKISAAEAVMKDADPELFSRYQQELGAFEKANEGRSMALADGSAYGRLRSALLRDRSD